MRLSKKRLALSIERWERSYKLWKEDMTQESGECADIIADEMYSQIGNENNHCYLCTRFYNIRDDNNYCPKCPLSKLGNCCLLDDSSWGLLYECSIYTLGTERCNKEFKKLIKDLKKIYKSIK